MRDPFPEQPDPHEPDRSELWSSLRKATLPAAGPILNGTNNAIDPTPFHQNQQEYTFRVDQTIGKNDFLWFRYSDIQNDTTSSGGRPALQAGQVTIRAVTGASTTSTPSAQHWCLQGQYGHAHFRPSSRPRCSPIPGPANWGFSPAFGGNFIGGLTVIPAVNVDGFFGGGESQGSNPIVGEHSPVQWKRHQNHGHPHHQVWWRSTPAWAWRRSTER